MTILGLKEFMKKHNLKRDTMIESQLQRVYNLPIRPRYSNINSDKRFKKKTMDLMVRLIGQLLT